MTTLCAVLLLLPVLLGWTVREQVTLMLLCVVLDSRTIDIVRGVSLATLIIMGAVDIS